MKFNVLFYLFIFFFPPVLQAECEFYQLCEETITNTSAHYPVITVTHEGDDEQLNWIDSLRALPARDVSRQDSAPPLP